MSTDEVDRISVQDARQKVQAGQALLVCAYDSEARFQENELEGAISYPSFQSRLGSLPRDQEVIFYCG